MKETSQPGVSEEGELTTVAVPANKLSKAEKLVIFHAVREHNGNHPTLAKLAELPIDSLSRVLEMAATSFVVSMVHVDKHMDRLAMILERDGLYKKLLLAGAPKAMLRRFFAKSRREIEADRQFAGISSAIAGRPRRIDTDKAYEISGHWERLKEIEPGFPERIVMIHELFPDIGIASLFNLLENL